LSEKKYILKARKTSSQHYVNQNHIYLQHIS